MAAASSDTQGQPTAQQALSNLTPAQERQIMTLGYLPGLQQHNGLYGPMDTSESSQDTQTPQQAAEVPQRHCNSSGEGRHGQSQMRSGVVLHPTVTACTCVIMRWA